MKSDSTPGDMTKSMASLNPLRDISECDSVDWSEGPKFLIECCDLTRNFVIDINSECTFVRSHDVDKFFGLKLFKLNFYEPISEARGKPRRAGGGRRE
jgi:hypothetical protein